MTRGFAAAALCALAIASMASCGGASFEGDGDGGSSGSSSAGSTSKGGSASRGGASSSGGSTGTAGSMSGGGAPAGGSVSTAGTGSAGAPAGICSLPPESGNCNAYVPSFFHNPDTGVCEPFVYGGCGGNANRFESVEQCQNSCKDDATNLDSCEKPDDCMLVSPHCCGVCDGTLQDYTAVNVNDLAAFQAAHACGDVACEPCPPSDPTISNRPYLTATCRNGECVPVDIREAGVTDCQTSEDCFLRAGLACCEDCGGNSQVTALSNAAKLSELVCGDELTPCLTCLPAYPPELAATCEAGRCTLTYVP